jgi:FSR family fosmidomycin resistance protein-like MFS transporter
MNRAKLWPGFFTSYPGIFMAQAEAAAPLTWREQGVVWLISTGHGITHYIGHIIPVLSPVIKQEFNLSYTEWGLFLAIYQTGNLFATVFGAPFADITGRRQLLQVFAMALVSLSIVLLGLTTEYLLLCIIGVFISAGNQLWHPAAIPYLATRFDAHRGYAMSIHGMMSNVGDVLVFLVAPAMISGNLLIVQFAPMDWRDVIVINAVPGLLILPILIVRALKERAMAKKQGGGMDIKSYFRGVSTQMRNRTVLGIGLIAGLRATAQSGSRNFLPVYLVDQFSWSVAQAALALLMLNLGGSFGAVPAGMASDRYGRRKVMLIAVALATVAILALPLLKDELLIVLGVCFIGFSIYATRPVLMSWMMDVVPHEIRGTATSFTFLAQSAFSIPSMALTGYIADSFGVATIFYYFGAMLFLANLVIFALPKKS